MKRTLLMSLVGATGLLLAGCNDTGKGDGGDAFMSEVRQLTATAPEDREPANMDRTVASAPDHAEPDAL